MNQTQPRSRARIWWLATATGLAVATVGALVSPPGDKGAALAQSALAQSAIAQSAIAQSAIAPPAAERPTGCVPRPGMLGVARVVEIDTAKGPRFGLQQYPEHDFLREREVVLTFDDGPLRRHTLMVLNALAAHCTQATFFMVGQMALSDPEMVRQVARAGHTIAIHTWSHRNLRASGAAVAQREVELGISAVQRALGQPVAPFFRFPYLADSQAMLAHLSSRNIGVFSIDVDSRDFRTRNPKEMQRNVFSALGHKNKGILLFHDIQYSTAHGIRGVLDELASRGYRIVHVVPKRTATTVASYDAQAEAELARRNKVAAANPMNKRAVVFPMSPPGTPVESYVPSAAPPGASKAVVRVPGRPTASGVQPAAATPPAAAAPAPPAAPAAASAAAPGSQPVPQQRPPLRGTADDDDWRRSVFQQ